MTIQWTVEPGDRVGVETPRGNVTTAPVVGRELLIDDRQLVPHITVQLTDGVSLTVPETEATAP